MCLAIPGQIVEITPGDEHCAIVDIVGVRRRVNIRLVEDEFTAPGDWVLIHVGFAMSKIDEYEAQETLKLLREMGAAFSDEMEMLQQSQIE